MRQEGSGRQKEMMTKNRMGRKTMTSNSKRKSKPTKTMKIDLFIPDFLLSLYELFFFTSSL